jgi:hypothetical protein
MFIAGGSSPVYKSGRMQSAPTGENNMTRFILQLIALYLAGIITGVGLFPYLMLLIFKIPPYSPHDRKKGQ